ncbi:MAG: ATP-dependent DNA helicase [Thermoplasmatales archaeon]|nr:ATP-dependent DNA helicase [Thermoplasmatales archaeon]
MIDFFPYKPRKFQLEIISKIEECLKNKKNLVMEAPAGSGKTICALAPCISFTVEKDMGVIYITRTNSQQKQAISEMKRMGKKIKASGLQGRTNMCLLIEDFPSLRNCSNEELSRICARRKKGCMERKKDDFNRCIFFENFLKIKEDFGYILSSEEIYSYGKMHNACPYEINKEMVKKSRVVIAPYIYIFDEILREKFFSLYQYPPEKTILIIDEAHNLPDFCRELLSTSLSYNSLKMGIKEAEEYGVRDKSILSFLNIIDKIFEEMREEFKLSEEGDALIGDFFDNRIKKYFSIDEIKRVSESMIAYGEAIADIKEKNNSFPRSFLRSIGNFILYWINLDNRWVKLIEVDDENFRIVAYCLEPSIASSIINSFYSSIHMSGTLQPIDEYINSIGIEAEKAIFPSPFPKENRKIFYLGGVSTKYYMEDEMVKKIAGLIEEICNNVNKNTLVFFPSYSVMNRFINSLNIKRNLYIEGRNERQEELMNKIENFKRSGGVFLSVIGGKISEGIDFPSEELEIVLIVGLPYPPPSAKQSSLQEYYERKSQNGWKYAFEAPAIRKTMQAIGRLIRNENDRGIAIILDERATRFKKYVEIEKTNDALAEIKKFFGKS